MRTYLRTTALATLAVFSLSGCLGGMMTKPDGSPDDQQQTKAGGALAGALLGAVAGALAGGDTKSTLIGAAVGGGAGYLLGNEVAKRKDSYKSREEMIAQESRRVAETLSDTRRINASLRSDIRGYEAETRSLQSKIAQGKERKEALGVQKEKVDKRHKDSQEALDAVTKELEISEKLYEDAKSGSSQSDAKKLANWEKRIADLKKEKQTLQKHSGQLQALSATLG